MLKAIETSYKGYRFRSRLEARWALFFDTVRIPWVYEPEGYELPSGRGYLPDFCLPSIGNTLVDVKPLPEDFNGEPHFSEGTKEAQFSEVCWQNGSTQAYALIFGEPGPVEPGGKMSSYVVHAGDYPYYFCVCPWCCRVGLEFDGRGARVCGYQQHHKTEEEAFAALRTTPYRDVRRVDDKCYSFNDPMLLDAFSVVRAHRFGT